MQRNAGTAIPEKAELAAYGREDLIVNVTGRLASIW